jgi:hypothetical protein
VDTSGKCISVVQPQKQCDASTVTLLDGSCGASCGANQVQKQGKCQCQNGYKKDDKGTGCVEDPSFNITPPPSSSTGGGSCSLVKTSITPAPIVTPKTYDLQEAAVVGNISYPGILNQLKDVTLVRGTSTDLQDIYTLKATFKAGYQGKSYGQAQQLTALDTSTGTTIGMVPKNITSAGVHKCTPAISGETATFTCIYKVSENKTLPAGKLYLLVALPNSLTLTTTSVVDPKDFAVTESETPMPPAPPATPVCKDTLPVLMVDGTCGGGCGGNEDMKEMKCVCKAGFSVDATTKACMPAANANNALQPAGSPTGNNCGLNPLATTHGEVKTILALLLLSMLAARACHSSRH